MQMQMQTKSPIYMVHYSLTSIVICCIFICNTSHSHIHQTYRPTDLWIRRVMKVSASSISFSHPEAVANTSPSPAIFYATLCCDDIFVSSAPSQCWTVGLDLEYQSLLICCANRHEEQLHQQQPCGTRQHKDKNSPTIPK